MSVFSYPSEFAARDTRYEDRYPDHYAWLCDSQIDFTIRRYLYPDFVTPRSQVHFALFEFAVQIDDPKEATMFALYSRMQPS